MAVTYNTTFNNLYYVYTWSAALGWSANPSGVAAFDYFPDAFAVNDCVYFGNTYLAAP